jgi:transcriptional regulator with XRE-family HTH domain
MESIGKRVGRLRRQRKLSQIELANRVGVRQSFISKLEAGEQTNPGAVALKGLAKALGCTTDYLVGMHEDDESEQLPTAVVSIGV